MSYKNTLIVGMALLGALALLTGTFVTIPSVLAYEDPNLKSYTDPDANKNRYTDPDANRVRILVR